MNVGQLPTTYNFDSRGPDLSSPLWTPTCTWYAHKQTHTHIIRHINTRIKNINLKTVLDSSLMILTIILEFLSSDFQIKSIPFVRKELFCCVIINFALQNSIKAKCTPQFLIGSIKDVIDWSSIYSFRRRQFQKTQFIAIYCVLCSI